MTIINITHDGSDHQITVEARVRDTTGDDLAATISMRISNYALQKLMRRLVVLGINEGEPRVSPYVVRIVATYPESDSTVAEWSEYLAFDLLNNAILCASQWENMISSFAYPEAITVDMPVIPELVLNMEYDQEGVYTGVTYGNHNNTMVAAILRGWFLTNDALVELVGDDYWRALNTAACDDMRTAMMNRQLWDEYHESLVNSDFSYRKPVTPLPPEPNDTNANPYSGKEE